MYCLAILLTWINLINIPHLYTFTGFTLNTLTIVFRNISKRKLRSILTICGIVLGVRLMFSLLIITASGIQSRDL